jgi:L-ascorbate metabolism protein UlaG (beta-lactamase superfamily)
MKITKLQQSGFIFEADNGYKLGLDIGSYTPEEKLHEIALDAMIVSHIHGDHFSIEAIKQIAPKKLYLNEECIELLGEEEIVSEITKVAVGDVITIDGFTVHFFDVDHGPNVKIRPRENFGLLIEIDGKKIYFAGDMFYASGIDVTTLDVDYALIPVGTHYTFGPNEALAFAQQFKNIVNLVPMHFEQIPETRDQFVQLAIAAGCNTLVL